MRAHLVKARAARRGAAEEGGALLVEAILVIVSLLGFLVAVLYVGRAFERELQVQSTARAAAFAYAMNGCEGDAPSALLAPEDVKLIGAPVAAAGAAETVADGQQGKIEQPIAAKAFADAAKKTGLGMPSVASVSARGSASMSDGAETMSSNLHSRTTLLCNEKPRPGMLSDAINYVREFID